MRIIINNSSMQPIYEQIINQIKTAILQGEIKENDPLPSVRTLAKDLRISALTAKKAYDSLEQEGFIVTVHGKGSFVSHVGTGLMLEEKKKEVEADLETAVQKALVYGITKKELLDMLHLILEE